MMDTLDRIFSDARYSAHSRSVVDSGSEEYSHRLRAGMAGVIFSGFSFSLLVCLDFVNGMAPSAATHFFILPIIFGFSAIYYGLIKSWHFAGCVLMTAYALTMLSCYGLDAGYAVHRAGRHFPLIDAQLSRMDGMLGFNWMAMFHAFLPYPLLIRLIRIPYDLAPQLLLIMVYLCLAQKRYEQVYKILTANFIGLFAVHVIALVLPALGAYHHAGLSWTAHPGAMLTTRAEHVPSLLAARMVVAPDLNSFRMYGLVTFPSYHAVMVGLLVWGFWDMPRLRVPALIWSAIIAVATPLHGSHYLCDMLAGGAIAAMSIWLAGVLTTLGTGWLQVAKPNREPIASAAG